MIRSTNLTFKLVVAGSGDCFQCGDASLRS
jgi:hypothetical protein